MREGKGERKLKPQFSCSLHPLDLPPPPLHLDSWNTQQLGPPLAIDWFKKLSTSTSESEKWFPWKKLRFSSRPSQSKSLAHGATGNCQRIALESAVSLPQKSARSYLLGLNKFGVCSNFHCSFRCISKFWRSLPASFPCQVEVKGTTSSLCEWEAKPSLLRVPLRAARECLLKIFLKWRDRGLWTSSKLWCVCFGKVSIR